MSSSMSDDALAAQAGYLTYFLRGTYFNVSARVLYFWDYCITFSDEVEYVWGRRITPATALFLVNRYVNLSVTVLELLEQTPFQTTKRFALYHIHPFDVFTRLFGKLWPVRSPDTVVTSSFLDYRRRQVSARFLLQRLDENTAFASLRVYATWGRDWRPALPVLFLALVSPAVNIFLDSRQIISVAPPPSFGCAAAINVSADLYSKFVIASRATTSAYDGLALVLTAIRSVILQRRARELTIGTGLLRFILRDGALYFLFLLGINLAQIIVSSELPGNDNISYYVTPITTMLISRFLLDLRKVAQKEEDMRATSVYLTTELASAYAGSDRFDMSSLAGPVDNEYDDDGFERNFKELHELTAHRSYTETGIGGVEDIVTDGETELL